MKIKRASINLIFILTIIIMSITILWDFSFQLQNALKRETYRTLDEVSNHYNKTFVERIEHNKTTLKVLSNTFATKTNWQPKELGAFLNQALLDGGFSKLIVSGVDGISYSNTNEVVDINDRDYFKATLKGESVVTQPIDSQRLIEKTIVISVPIMNGKQSTGILFGLFPISTAGSQLLDSSYYSDGYGYIVSPNGSLIFSSEHKDRLSSEDNLFEFFNKTKLIDCSLKDIKNTMKKNKTLNFEFEYKNEKRFVSLMPSTVNDWYTFSIASDTLMLKQENATNRVVIILVIKLILLASVITAWIIYHNQRRRKEVSKANQQYQSLLDHINGGVIVTKHAKKMNEILIDYVSNGFTTMTGYTKDDIIKDFDGRFIGIIFEEDLKEAFSEYFKQTKNANEYHISYRVHKKDGSTLWIMDNGYIVKDAHGLYNHSIISDISVMKKQEEELKLGENRFAIAMNASSGTLFEVDLKKQVYTHFENAKVIFGVNGDVLLNETKKFSHLPYSEFAKAIPSYFFHPDDLIMVGKEMKNLLEKGVVSFDARLRRYDQTYIWARVNLSIIRDEHGVATRLVGYMSDIDGMKKQAALLETKAQMDAMSGLYNKVAMNTLVDKELSINPNELCALIVLDIDNFKDINDTYGHAFGDVVLIEISSKLKASFRNDDILARMGGDEFAVLMKNVTDTSMVLKKVSELSNDLRQTYLGNKEEYKITCSIGVIMIENRNESFESYYRKADAALYHSKQNGKDQFVLYQEKDADDYSIKSHFVKHEEIQNLKNSYNLEEHIFDLLYASKDFSTSINMALAAIGEQFHVSRVSIFECREEHKKFRNIFEWVNDGIPSVMNQLQDIEIKVDDESIMDSFDEKGLLYCNDVKQLPKYLRSLMESQGIMSTLQVTIVNDDKTYGFIGFEACDEYRVWTSEEIAKLTYLAKIVSVFLFKKEVEATLIENLHTRLKVLDILPDYICVVNPLLHTIEYANKRMQELLPSVKPGKYCFTDLRGGQCGPCETCLIEKIKQGNVDNLEIMSEDHKTKLKVKALSIRWTNSQEMVLLYGSSDYISKV
ncbi:MAG: diguanylate cyclase [Erysipelotrichaceae bacterium]